MTPNDFNRSGNTNGPNTRRASVGVSAGRFDTRSGETPADLPERLASQLGTALDRDAAIDPPPKPTYSRGADLPTGLITRQAHSPAEPGGRGVLAIGSLFSGIGGLELGLEWAGLGPVRWQVEMNPFCRRVLAKHWPDADRSVTDVRNAGRATLAPVDLVCGGFPCQDVSSAGKGAGLAGERSGLWYEFRRIVDELRPEWVVVENVQAIPFPLSAADVGAWHRRSRVFIVAHDARQPLGVARQPRQSCSVAPDPQRQPLRQQSRRSGGEEWTAGEAEPRHDGAEGDVRDDDGTRRDEGSWLDWSGSPAERAAWWDSEPDVGRVVHGVPNGVDRRRALGNAVVPQCAEVIGWIIRELAGLTDYSPVSAAECSGGSRSLTPTGPITARAAGRLFYRRPAANR
jgi:DNA (cytosine-5)-methyltransferase 1